MLVEIFVSAQNNSPSSYAKPIAIVTGILLGRYILGSVGEGEGDWDSGLGKIIRAPAVALWKSKLTHYLSSMLISPIWQHLGSF